MHLIVVGGVAAGTKAAASPRRSEPSFWGSDAWVPGEIPSMNHMALHDQSAPSGVWALFCRNPMKPFRPTVLRRRLPNTRNTVTVEPCVGADMTEIDRELDKAIGR